MKPIAVFRHSPTEGPGYFGTFLDRAGMPWQLVRVDAQDPIPARADEFSGLVFMGGPMSVNDDLPWIVPALKLIRDAVAKDVPVLGHCLGGQLMAKALGGLVGRASFKEIGWGEVRIGTDEIAQAWFGAQRTAFDTFHWHGETFTIPAGSQRVLSSAWCKNQGFALGPHLGLQCHIEMTAELVHSWCASGQDEIAHSHSPAVQSVPAILADLEQRLGALHEVADAVYARWLEGCNRAEFSRGSYRTAAESR
jgi:GMP synthase-like glutamine amidotransferase